MVGASLCIMSTGALAPFVGATLHLNQTQLGLLLSVQLAGSVAMTSLAGLLTDRFGDKAIVRWTGILMGLALIAAAWMPSFTWLVGWLLVYGIGYAAVTPAGSHAIIFFFKKADRGVAMGIRQCGVPIAGVIGSLLLPAIASRFEYRAAFAAAGVFTLIACLIAAGLYREPHELEGERVSVRTMFVEMLEIARESQLILLTLTSMLLICGQMALIGFLCVTLEQRANYPLSLALPLFTLSQIAAIGGRLSWGWLSDRVFGGSRALPLAVVCVLSALIALAFSSIDPATPPVLAGFLAAAMGFVMEGWLGVSVIGFAEIGGEEHAGSSLGVGLTWTLLAAFIAPALFGAFAEMHGYADAWRGLALLLVLGVVPALLAARGALSALRSQ